MTCKRSSTTWPDARLLALGFASVLALGCRPPASAPASGGQPPPEHGNGQQPPEQPPEQPIAVEPPLCEGQPCESPRQCISYYGIAGPAGPLFRACEIPCSPELENGGCPDGMRCVTIADGPGDVCQASE